jgi:hypothetical protein
MFPPRCAAAAFRSPQDRAFALLGPTRANKLGFAGLRRDYPSEASEVLRPRDAAFSLTPAERALLLRLQRQALRYFLDNQRPGGLVLDRQRNHGVPQAHGWCSTAATGMGFIALALAAAPPYRLLAARVAAARVRVGLETALERLPHDHGIMPHFTHSATGAVGGSDHLSTVDSSWLLAGGLWAAAFLKDRRLEDLATRLYDRVDWRYWTVQDAAARGLLRHGKGRDGRFLDCCWDRLNGETVFMYILGAGAAEGRALTAASGAALRPFYGSVAGLRFHSADLGLFVFQYGLDLLDLQQWRAPGGVDLLAEARLATLANQRACRTAAATFATYRRFWGLSAGDGPGEGSAADTYRSYAPAGPVDGTAHVTATLAAVAHQPEVVLENLHEVASDRELNAGGRYGFSNLNVDHHWVGRDMVGIDAGAAVLALDNYLMGGRVREVFHGLPCVEEGLQRLRFTRTPETTPQTAAGLSACRVS